MDQIILNIYPFSFFFYTHITTYRLMIIGLKIKNINVHKHFRSIWF